MQVAQVQHGVGLEGGRQPAQGDRVVAQLDAQRVAQSASVHAGSPQREPHQRMRGIPVLKVEEVGAPAKDASLMVALEAKPLSQVDAPDARLELGQARALRGFELG